MQDRATESPVRWLVTGAVAGLIAGIVFAMFEMVVAAVMGKGFFMPLRMIAAIAVGHSALMPAYALGQAIVIGGALHMALSMMYGVVLAAITVFEPSLRAGRGTLVGAATVFGLALWLINFSLIAPHAFAWFGMSNHAVQFVAHTFFFGTALGALLATRLAPASVFRTAPAA